LRRDGDLFAAATELVQRLDAAPDDALPLA